MQPQVKRDYKRAPRLADKEALEITLSYFDHTKQRQALKAVGQGEGVTGATSTEDIERENSRNATHAWRALRAAFARKLVEVIPTRRPKLDLKLAERMRETYPHLLGVQVVDLDELSPDRQMPDEKIRSLDDKIHAELGHAVAKAIAQGMMFQDGSVIGVGSGRAVYYTVRDLQEFPALGAKNVTVQSFTGWVHAKNHYATTNTTREFEADTHAAMLLQCFGQAVINTVNRGIAYRDDENHLLEKLRKASHLSETQWVKTRPRYALLGVGVIGPGHRLYEEANATRHEPGLQAIVEPLRRLVEISEKVHARARCRFYYPVADIANQLFCVQGCHWNDIDATVRQELENLVTGINKQLLTVTAAQLKEVENVILIAGTETKAVAIRHLLHTEHCNVRFLCTDRKTADRILKKDF